jgi:hypothetical protein
MPACKVKIFVLDLAQIQRIPHVADKQGQVIVRQPFANARRHQKWLVELVKKRQMSFIAAYCLGFLKEI